VRGTVCSVSVVRQTTVEEAVFTHVAPEYLKNRKIPVGGARRVLQALLREDASQRGLQYRQHILRE